VGQAHRFDVVSGQHSAYTIEYVSDIGQEGDRVGLVVRLRYERTAVEGSVDLPVIVAILFEDVLQEHQLHHREVWLCVSEWIAPFAYWMGDDGTWLSGKDSVFCKYPSGSGNSDPA
jgi:hypothetical protein